MSRASYIGLIIAFLLLSIIPFGWWRLEQTRADRTTKPTTRSDDGLKQQVTVLSDSARKQIWDIEDRAFQISHKAVPQLTAAIARADTSAIAEFFSDNFRGQAFAADTGERIERDFAWFRFQTPTRDTRTTVDRQQFAEYLIEQVAAFQPGQVRAQLPLLYLSPADPKAMDGAWHGTWILRVFGTTKNGGPGEFVARGNFTAEKLPQDFNSERGWISSWDMEQASTCQATHVLMEEISARSGIDLSLLRDNWTVDRGEFMVTPGGVYACDFNNDRNTDLLLTDRGTATLYAGEGNAQFRDVTLIAGLPPGPVHAAFSATGFADFDNDGDEDLILAGALYENRNAQFTRRGYLSLDKAVGIAFGDYDRDGLVDMYISNAAPAPQQAKARTSWIDDHSGQPNQLLRNRGKFQFQDVTEATGTGAGARSTFTSVWLDADDDHWPDIYVINELGNNVLLRNQGNGTFAERHIGPKFDGFAMGVTAGDINGDGSIDLYLGNMFSKAGKRILKNIPPDAYPPELIETMESFVAGNLLLENHGELDFKVGEDSSISSVGWAYGTSTIDLDSDGWLDLHATAGFASFARNEPDG